MAHDELPSPSVEKSGSDALTSTQVMLKDSSGQVLPGSPLDDTSCHLHLPGYDFLSILGRGGMGTVYLARQRSLDRYVAVKVIRGDFTSSRSQDDRLQEEALTMGMLSHPNVLSCYDIIRTGDGLFLVMEYIPGRLTGPMLVSHYGIMSEQVLVKVLLAVVDGLSYIYHKGFMHRDLKPDNLMFYRDDTSDVRTMDELFHQAGTRVVICDFGIAQSVNEIVDTENVLGSPMYMAPEQFYAVELLDFRADIYSMGCVAYYFLTGHAPFQQKERTELLDYKLSHGVPNPRRENPSISGELGHIVQKMGRIHPDDRYQSYQELNDDLEHLLAVKNLWSLRSSHRLQQTTWKGTMLVMLVLLLLPGGWLFWHHVVRPHFDPVQISLACSLGYWKRYDQSSWSLVTNDKNEPQAYMRGISPSPLVLHQVMRPGSSVDFDMRAYGEGTVRFGLSDSNMRVLMMYIDWSRSADESMTSFHLTGEKQRQVFIGELMQKSKFDWVHITMRVYGKSVVISANGKMLGVAHFHDHIDSCNFYLKAEGVRIVELKNVYCKTKD